MADLHEFTLLAVEVSNGPGLNAGDVLVQRKGGRLTTVRERKADGPIPGWWCGVDATGRYRTGLADFVIERDWLLVVEVSRGA